MLIFLSGLILFSTGNTYGFYEIKVFEIINDVDNNIVVFPSVFQKKIYDNNRVLTGWAMAREY